MRFFKLSSILVVTAFLMLSLPQTSKAHDAGTMGFTAAMGMPSGMVPAVAMPSSTFSRVVVTMAASTSFNYFIANNFQVDITFGFLSVDPGGEADPATTLSFGLAGKYFMSSKDAVSTYLTAGFNFTSLPTSGTGDGEMTGSIFNILAAVGAQGYLNDDRTVALFIQMGLGYNMGTLETGGVATFEGSNLNLGGSAIGASVYF